MRAFDPAALAALALAALLAAGGLDAAEPLHAPAKVERIEGTQLSRVTLTEQAASRLGIQTTEIRAVPMTRTRIVTGVALGPVATVTSVASADDVTAVEPLRSALRVEVKPLDELERAAGGRPARLLPLNGAEGTDGWRIEPAGLPSVDAIKDPDGPLVFEVPGPTPGLAVPGAVLVELALGDEAVRKVAPYAALLYDVEGGTWVYTNPEPLVFVRHSVVVDYIDGDLAVLSDGPEPGTKIASIGIAELFGTEFKIGK